MPSALITTSIQAASLSSVSNVFGQIARAYQEGKPFVFDVREFLRFVVLSFLTSKKYTSHFIPSLMIDSSDKLQMATVAGKKVSDTPTRCWPLLAISSN